MSLELLPLFCAGERVICAVSGGADSMALLWSLHSQRETLGITVQAAHFNHRLRAAQSQRDENFVRDFCKQHGILLHVGSGDVASYAEENGRTIEEAARILRYRFLQSLPCDKLATAHTADDQAETIVMHLLRGSGLTGLCGIAPMRDRLVRPMLHLTRQQIEAFLRSEGLSWVEDGSNADDRFTRNRVRHEIMPLLKRENPRLLENLSNLAEILRSEDALLDQLASEVVREASVQEGYRCERLLAAPDALQKRALRLIVRRHLPQDVSLKHISLMRKTLQNPSASASLSLPHGLLLRKSYGTFTLTSEQPPLCQTQLLIPGQTLLPSVGLKITCEITKNLQNNANSPFHFLLKYDMIGEHGITVRPRQVGDMLRLSCRKSLKKWFIERKIPVFERYRLPVLVSGGRIVAVAGLGADRAFQASEGEQSLSVRIEPIADWTAKL